MRLVILILPIVKLVDSVVLLVERKFIAPVFEIKFSPDPIEILPVMFVDVHIVADLLDEVPDLIPLTSN